MIELLKVSLVLACFGAVNRATAQTPIEFQNTLNAPINLALTNMLDGSETFLRIPQNGVAPFNIPSGASVFDLRVMPLDNTGTGFRFDGRDLASIAANSGGQAVPIGGIIEPRCHFYWVSVCGCDGNIWLVPYRVCRMVRVAAFVEEFTSGGQLRRVTAPVERYSPSTVLKRY